VKKLRENHRFVLCISLSSFYSRDLGLQQGLELGGLVPVMLMAALSGVESAIGAEVVGSLHGAPL
jgi:hypothetical protein